jgi:hypothetical protein
MRAASAIAFLASSLTILTACAEKGQEAPLDRGVCFHAIPQKGGTLKFNKLAENVDSVEKCASELEGMRLRFLRMGGKEEITGAYQGSYLFLQREGIFRSETLNGNRYVMLVRTGDGRLAMPGAMPME